MRALNRFLLLAMLCLMGAAPAVFADLNRLLEPVPGANLTPRSRSEAAATPATGAAPEGALLLTESELVQAIQKDLPRRYSVKGELRVSLVRSWTPLRLPGNDFFAECLQLPVGGLTTNMAFTVRGVSAGKIVGEWPIQVRVEVWQEVWVASERLERAEVLTPGKLSVQKIDLLRESSSPIPADTEVSGLEMAQAVAAGRLITRRDLVERSLVRKGQFVDAVVNDGALSLRLRAMALEGGPAGAVIRVRNLESRKEFFAQVINETQVQVRF